MQTRSSIGDVAPVYTSLEMRPAESSIAFKGNRLGRANVRADRTSPGRGKMEIVNGKRKVPMGCEAALSRLVAKDNAPVRCSYVSAAASSGSPSLSDIGRNQSNVGLGLAARQLRADSVAKVR